MSYRKQSVFWGIAIFVSTILFACFLKLYIESLAISLNSENSILSKLVDSSFVLPFLILLPFFFIVWFTKILTGNLVKSIKIMHEANHRTVMTKVFLSLIADGSAEKQDRLLILNSLFSPILSDSTDGNPPHWVEILMEKMNIKSKN